VLILFAGSKNGSPDGFIGHAIVVCDFSERFLILKDTAEHRGPFLRRNLISRFGRAWMSVCDWQQKGIASVSLILLEQFLELAVEETGGGMEVN
jgi:hypothetical protein